MKQENRFQSIWKEGSNLKGDGMKTILVDTETGVNYLLVSSGASIALTPLLDSDGKVIVSALPLEGI